jgi:hypothetical protein
MSTPTAQREPTDVPVRASADKGAPAARRRVFSPRQLAFIIGVPAAWGVLLLFHPLGEPNEFYSTIDGHVTAWLTVHIGMGIFVPLFAGVVYLLLRDVKSVPATISRLGLAVFAILYAAWELVLGVGTGILTQQTNALPEAQQAVGADLVDSYADSGVITTLSILGSIGLGVAVICAVIALRRAYRVGWAPLVLMMLAVPLIAVHEPPFGPAGLAVFIVAVLLLVRQQASTARSAPPLDRQVSAEPA